ncbi:MAG: glutathione S-transferase [Thermoleophilia bacterium]|nr:glutathione S-transferase [Thermoleophilia bacterium]
MIDLYFMPGAASLSTHVLLEEVGAPYRLLRVTKEDGRIEPPELERLNPHRRVPTLVDGDLVLYEAAACAMHLADAHPRAGLAPALGTPERAHWYRWLVYLTNTVQATFMIFFYPERYTADPGGAAAVQAEAESALAGMREFLAGELRSGGPHLLGERYSAADVYLFMLTRWGRRLETRWWDEPVLGAHFRRVFERPAVQRAWAQEGLDPPA